jgi:ribulose 1,5-bisphosphate carboxylase large subunit-like protein
MRVGTNLHVEGGVLEGHPHAPAKGNATMRQVSDIVQSHHPCLKSYAKCY